MAQVPSSSNKPVYQSVVIELAICPIKLMADDHWGISWEKLCMRFMKKIGFGMIKILEY